MPKYKVRKIQDKKTWEDFVLTQQPKTFLQSWNWGETNKKMGDKIFRLGIFENNQIVGAALMIEQKARRGPHFIIPGGPLIDWTNKSLVGFFVKTIKDLAVLKGAWFIRIRPELINSIESQNLLRKLGFVSSPMHLHAESTQVIPIDKNDDEILYGMRKNTRYLIRKSLKVGLEFDSTANAKGYLILKRLQSVTAKRHKFVGFSPKLFKAQLENFGADKQAQLFVCKLKNKILAAAIIVFYGDTAYYHYSGSIGDYKKIPYSYFLQWKIIQQSKKRGLKFYNLWGVAPNTNTRHRYSGVTIFKKGFGGDQIDWIHAHDLPTSRFYWLTYLFESGRKFARRL